MGVRPHPKFDEIKRELQKFSKQGKSLSAMCYRCVQPQFANDLVSGLGSQLHGARWTPKRSFPTVYLSDNVEVALEEYLARGRRLKIPDHKSLPMVTVSVRVRVANLIDITEPTVAVAIKSICQAEKIHWRSIQDRREAVSQAIGRALMEICFSGIIAASQAVAGSRNIVIFPDKLSTRDSLEPG